MTGLLHVLFWLRAEGTPRLAQSLLREERRRGGPDGAVAVLHGELPDLRPELEAEGFAIHSLEYGHRWRYDTLYRRTVELLRRIRPSGVVVYPLGPHVPVVAAARRMGVPVVLHLGNTPPTGNVRQKRLMRAQLQAGDLFGHHYAACSSYVRDCALLAYDLGPDRVSAVPNGISLDWFAEARGTRKAERPADALRVGMIASLEDHKDQAILVAAFAHVVAQFPRAELLLHGEGSNRPRLEQQVQALGLGHAVRLPGRVENVRQVLQDLDVFAYAVKEQEGLGIALVEAMAAGVPVVTSSVGACLEVTEFGRRGRVVQRREPAEWAQVLMAARSDPPCPLEALRRYELGTCLDGYLQLLAWDRHGRPDAAVAPPTGAQP